MGRALAAAANPDGISLSDEEILTRPGRNPLKPLRLLKVRHCNEMTSLEHEVLRAGRPGRGYTDV